MDHRRFVGMACMVLVVSFLHSSGAGEGRPNIDFNQDIRPILAENCYQCHGPDKDKRQTDLRLDSKKGLFSRGSDRPVVSPGKPGESELYQRIISDDLEARMPAAESNKVLTKFQIGLIRRWIEEGAQWAGHWSYIPPKKLSVPSFKRDAFVRNDIDRWILAKLNEAKLPPSPEADRITLARRLSFDLLGLPPKDADVAAFLADKNPNAYERYVDRLLASPHYGERMAMYWLDLVRFGDTIGYHSDNPMNVFPYRDYVIQSFQNNKPFDRFTIEQIAGDLLPSASQEQKIASTYNRILMTTEEGGAQAKEYEAKYAADRVRNVSAVWLGATMGCCQCHDHKFDPFTTKDFYQFAAYFADIQEAAVGKREPGMPVLNDAQATAIKRLESEIAAKKKILDASIPEMDAEQAAWERQARKKKTAVPPAVLAILGVDEPKRSPAQKTELAAYYRTITLRLAPVRLQISLLENQKAKLLERAPKTLISVSGPRRAVRVLPRGNWLDESGPIVTPAPPRFLVASSPPTNGTRLDLAQWLISNDNALTARVFVNRLWKLFFGQGLSKSLEDLGSQGEWPTHPELLDWLAVEFRDSGWDVRRMVRLMVLSGTYRQSSHPRTDLTERDPFNRLYARQSRFRLDAEMVRDQALACSGLLDERIGGPSVKPYQPAGYWSALNFPPRDWKADHGKDLYRRGMYTHWQRTFPHPSLLSFDAPSREECTVERPRSNIPQQALVLLNDPSFVEAARVLAARGVKEKLAPARQIDWMFRRVLTRDPTAEECNTLIRLYEKHLAQYRKDEKSAEQIRAVGEFPAPEDVDAAELAAWTSVARTLLNLHETITRS